MNHFTNLLTTNIPITQKCVRDGSGMATVYTQVVLEKHDMF